MVMVGIFRKNMMKKAPLPKVSPLVQSQPLLEKCGVTKIQICEIMGMVGIFRKNMMKKAPLPKVSPLVQSQPLP